ncbi:MAG: FecR family protein, partial [Acidobacteriota bacterium]|nr:FecR family protein [Acidobacteriota bacterium]
MARGGRSPLVLDWFNITYRSVAGVLVGVVLLVAAAGGGWYYVKIYQPRAAASGAIDTAQRKLAEASRVADEAAPSHELLENANVSLREAEERYRSFSYEDARVAAMQSEQFSLKILRLAQGSDSGSHLVHFFRLEGDVRVKRSGEFAWETADSKMELKIGDQIKTASSASAQLLYFDGTVTTIQSGSLMEIRELFEDPVTKVRRVREKLNRGELVASTQNRNVDGSYHEVATEQVAARTEDEGQFSVTYNDQSKKASFSVFDG